MEPSAKVVVSSDNAAGIASAAANPWNVSCQQDPRAAGEAAEQRAGNQQRDAGEEQLAAAEQVPQPPEQQGEAGGRQRICGDDPGQSRQIQSDAHADRRQRDVEDREVNGEHEPGA